MDTYLKIDYDKCVKCGLCVEACTYQVICGGRNHTPTDCVDVLPCRGCGEPCKDVCFYDAISWTRY